MPIDKPDKRAGGAAESANGPKKPTGSSSAPGVTGPEKTAETDAPSSLSGMEASFWDESQIKEVMRHAGATGRRPEEFFNKKWKDRLIHGRKDEDVPQASDRDDRGEDR